MSHTIHNRCDRCDECHECLVLKGLLTKGEDCGYGKKISLDEALDIMFPLSHPIFAEPDDVPPRSDQH